MRFEPEKVMLYDKIRITMKYIYLQCDCTFDHRSLKESVLLFPWLYQATTMSRMRFEKDGKWSWIVLSMLTFIVFLEVGTIKGLSVLLPDIKEQLSSSTWILGSCISFIVGWGYFVGKLVLVLGRGLT